MADYAAANATYLKPVVCSSAEYAAAAYFFVAISKMDQSEQRRSFS